MNIIKNINIFTTDKPTKIPTEKKSRKLIKKPFLNLVKELTDMWSIPNDSSDCYYNSMYGRINSHRKGNYIIDFSSVSQLSQKATHITLKHLESITLDVCTVTSKSENLYLQAKKALSINPKLENNLFEEIPFSTSSRLNALSIAVVERAEITFFNDIVSVSINLIELEPQLENEIMRYLLNLIPPSLYSYYLSQKGQVNDMKSLSPAQKLREVCQNYLEMSLQSPPVIHRSSSVDQDVVEKLEQLINETKQAKRMTFKTAEEIKQVVLEASGVEEEVTVSDDRERFISTVIELYDSMFHLVRMFRTNGDGELFAATSKELKRMEFMLREIDLEALHAIGKQIDPTFMQGVAVVPSAEANGLDQYVVYDEIRKGFKDLKKNRVIREAQVITVLN
ncbi:nucleotide exchange factor GrpE [Exiguobacterium sp. SL-10]|uniref:nucleotide exchange factor GrpE n=1 Tax=Exiguobacterium sp. SL-10 TaxID=2510962 RepID=UPI00103C8FD3|nr:nucleotide exchange factor GrpE [Exiguobacterium sp. SL-10]TCI28151.1 nucleotide exchange factor GrpE [Exiguobacterium sp. SL-10]